MPTVLATAEPFNGENVVDNFVRLGIVIVGVTLALVAVKIAWAAAVTKPRDPARGLGALAFACFVLTPSVSGILRFGNPLQIETSALYGTGLVLGAIAVGYHVRVIPPWTRWRNRRRDRRAAR